MSSLVLYDSQYGNTEKIAQAIYEGVSQKEKASIQVVNEANLSDLERVDLLIVGSPTQGGRPTQQLQTFLDSIPAASLQQLRFAAFDTRFLEKDQKFALRMIMKTIGYAAPKIDDVFRRKGAQSVAAPEGFIVEKMEGPLSGGEIERARQWGRQLSKAF